MTYRFFYSICRRSEFDFGADRVLRHLAVVDTGRLGSVLMGCDFKITHRLMLLAMQSPFERLHFYVLRVQSFVGRWI